MDLPTVISRISPFPILGVFFIFSPNFNRTVCKQTVKILIRHCFMPSVFDLGMHCLSMSHKKDTRLIWVKLSHEVLVLIGQWSSKGASW